ncbi:MAG: hypothetical protein ACRDFR_08520, partial [Candidatus Limnocylindria bacterium]
MSRTTVPRRLAVSVVVVLGSMATSVMVGGPAFAHERRDVVDLHLVVGFGTEPAFAGQPNSAELILSEGPNERPVVDGVDLQIEILFGEESMTLEMSPSFVVGVFGEPGDYEAHFLPTRPGEYTFLFTGTVGRQEIDESFTSGPETFGPMEDPGTISFPAEDPTSAELADRLDRETARLAAEAQSAREAAAAARDDADLARMLALVAIIVGGVALVAGVALGALALRKR